MEKYLEVKAEGKKAYDICITDSFAALAGELEQWGIKNRKLCIVTERQVASYYMDEVRGILEKQCAKLGTVYFSGRRRK